MSDQASEVDRLKSVYRNYRRNPRVRAQWDAGNAGNRAILHERERQVARLLQESACWPLDSRVILDVGCGDGHVLAGFRRLGADPAALYGVDLLPERIDEARASYPDLHFEAANAENLPFEDGRFQLVLAFTLFSSILDPTMAANVAREIDRVLARPGAVLWYDFRYDNPRNPHVRGIGRRGIEALFPGYNVRAQTLTLLPPLARRLGRATPLLYPALAAIPPLRTHILALLAAPNRA